MALKNTNIAKANPTAVANQNFINALYQEAQGRNATKAELDKFTGKTVKDASNLILGAKSSPFFGAPTPTTATPAPTKTVTPDQKSQLDKVASKPVENQSETDKKNIAYATKNLGYTPPTPSKNETPGSTLPPSSETPTYDYTTDPEYVNLSPENKSIIDTMNEAVNATDKETAVKAQYALQEAQKIVDPYSKIMLSFALNSIPDEFRIEKMSQTQKLEQMQNNLSEIQKQMKDAPIDQQRELNAMARQYETNINDTQDALAEKGLTYSSKRSDLEALIAAQNKDLIVAKSESFAEQSKKYEQAQSDAEKAIELQKASAEANLKNLAASTEAKVGTEKFKSLGLTDYQGNPITTVGGTAETPAYAGSIEQDRQAQILNLSKTIGEAKSPTALNTLYNL